MTQPPAGTVTFLFTDIEGSTKLWQDHPSQMQRVLARHDAILRQAIDEHGGYVFKTIGDAFCAAFAIAPDALRAALAAQLSLVHEPWDRETPIRVRIALHTGSAEARDGDYFGQPLNRTARLLSIGHGGQALLSDVTQGLVVDTLPPMTSLENMGEHRLKDLGRSENVYQLCHLDLPSDFPPLRSLDNPDLPNNLPLQLTSFIGREKELTDIKALLAKTRLLTLVGAGGSGKTRLSFQVAADLLEQFPDGVWLVEFAPLSDPIRVPQAVGDVLGVKEEPGKPIQRTLVEALKPKRLLLILDNCEHLVAACATLAADLLRHCPNVQVFATSREPLSVSGEQTYRVPSLSSPDPKWRESARVLSQYDAVRLFIERARAVQASFVVTTRNAPAVAQVCWRLDGIPLALELAAARMRSLSVEEINTRLDNRFRLLTSGTRDVLPRQQTLRAMVDWSYDLLSDQEKALLRRLSVFAGGWTLSAAEAVCAGEEVGGTGIEDFEVLDLLTSLVDKSLVVYEERGIGEGRFGMLETVRQYGQERLREKQEEQDVRQKHLHFFLTLTKEYELRQTHEYLHERVRQMQMEADNLRAALAQSQADSQVALRLAGTLRLYWIAANTYTEGLEHLAAALLLPGAQKRTTARAEALIATAMLLEQSDLAEARLSNEEALSISRELGYEQGIVLALFGLGGVVSDQGDYELGVAHLEEALTLSLKLEYHIGSIWVFNWLGRAAQRHGQTIAAQEHWERAVALAHEVHLEAHTVWTLAQLALLYRDEGQQGKAVVFAEESFELARAIGDRTNLAWVTDILAELCENNSEFEKAVRLLTEVQAIYKSEGWDRGVWPLILMTRACLGLGDYASAQTYLTQILGRTVLEEKHRIGWFSHYQGDLAMAGEDRDKARLFYRQSLSDFWAGQEMAGVFLALSGLSATEEAERAAQLHGAAQALSETDKRVGYILKAHTRQLQLYENAVAVSRSTLGDKAFIVTSDAGRAMTPHEAVEYALAQEE